MERQSRTKVSGLLLVAEKNNKTVSILFDFMTQKGDEDDADFSYRKFQNLYDFELKAGKACDTRYTVEKANSPNHA